MPFGVESCWDCRGRRGCTQQYRKSSMPFGVESCWDFEAQYTVEEASLSSMPFGVESCWDTKPHPQSLPLGYRLQCLSAWSPVGTEYGGSILHHYGLVFNAFRRGVLLGLDQVGIQHLPLVIVFNAFRRGVLLGLDTSDTNYLADSFVFNAFRRGVLLGLGVSSADSFQLLVVFNAFRRGVLLGRPVTPKGVAPYYRSSMPFGVESCWDSSKNHCVTGQCKSSMPFGVESCWDDAKNYEAAAENLVFNAFRRGVLLGPLGSC